MIEKLAEQIISEIGKGLPGTEQQYLMAPGVRYIPAVSGRDHQDAGILILLYPFKGQAYTVLIKRTEYQGAHSGQISFPGGKTKPSDPDTKATAIRETREELGIDLSEVTIMGSLTKLYIPVSNITVYPFIGYLREKPEFQPDPAEVRHVIEIPIEDLFSPGIIRHTCMEVLSTQATVPFYSILGNQIWGATAMIISEFLEIIRRSRSPQVE